MKMKSSSKIGDKMRMKWRLLLILIILVTATATLMNDQIDRVQGTNERKSSPITNERFTQVFISLDQWKIPAIWGTLVYGVTGATGELMNVCNWCWPHHQVEGRCAVDFNGLAKALGIAAASIVAWRDKCDSFAGSFMQIWEITVSVSKAYITLAFRR